MKHRSFEEYLEVKRIIKEIQDLERFADLVEAHAHEVDTLAECESLLKDAKEMRNERDELIDRLTIR